MCKKVEPCKTLWILAYKDDICDHLMPLYALCEDDAERQVQEWLERASGKVKRISLRAYPNGFMVQFEGLPGSV